MDRSIKRRTQEKELRVAGKLVGTREGMERSGMRYMGSIGIAAKSGYLTPRACERAGLPVTAEEMAHPKYCAMMADCHSDLCIEADSGLRRPCIPVFFRGEAAQGDHFLS